MGDQVLTREELENVIWEALANCMGINPDSPQSQSRIRMSWPIMSESGSQPDWDRMDNVCFARLTENTAEQYGTLHDIAYAYEASLDIQNEVIGYTRVHSLHLLFYGPHSFDDADQVRVGIFREEPRRILRRKHLYPVAGPQRASRIPELYSGAWWDRSDLMLTIYEHVIREFGSDYYKEAPISIKHSPK